MTTYIPRVDGLSTDSSGRGVTIEVLYVSAHGTELSCHSISGFKKYYNYMCSGTYYLIIGALSLPTISLRRDGEVRSNFSFTLLYKHV